MQNAGRKKNRQPEKQTQFARRQKIKSKGAQRQPKKCIRFLGGRLKAPN